MEINFQQENSFIIPKQNLINAQLHIIEVKTPGFL